MARLIYTVIASLDGYVNDAEGRFDWAAPDDEVHAFVNDLERPMGTHLYGRRMYETMAVWQTMGTAPQDSAVERDFGSIWRAAEKIVYSSTLREATTPRTRIERAFDADQIRQLKAASERDITVGGPHLAAAMIAANLVDEFHAFVHPFIVGGGTPFLPHDVRIPLELVREQRLDRIVHLHYRSAR